MRKHEITPLIAEARSERARQLIADAVKDMSRVHVLYLDGGGLLQLQSEPLDPASDMSYVDAFDTLYARVGEKVVIIATISDGDAVTDDGFPFTTFAEALLEHADDASEPLNKPSS
jgi:hypothetical protein